MDAVIVKLTNNFANCEEGQCLSAVLNIWRHHSSITKYLEACLRCPSELIERLASLSYLHANGFQKIVLEGLDDRGERVRLHKWGVHTSDAHTHSHSWSFASIVLAGALEIEEYRFIEGRKAMYFHFVPNLAAHRNGIRRTVSQRTVQAVSSDKRIIEAGDIHYLDSKKFHVVRNAANRTTISLLFQSRHLADGSEIVLPAGCSLNNPYEVCRIDADSYKREIKDTISALGM